VHLTIVCSGTRLERRALHTMSLKPQNMQKDLVLQNSMNDSSPLYIFTNPKKASLGNGWKGRRVCENARANYLEVEFTPFTCQTSEF